MIPRASVLIPCYNGQEYIGDAIESALNQTWAAVEVIVVDDGSTDSSVSVLEKYGDSIVWESGPNRGACAARNRAFEMSSGELIQFLDSDDKIEPEKIARQYELMMQQDADAVLCKIGLFGDDRGIRPEKREHPDPTGDPFLYFVEYPIGTPAALYRREIVSRSGGFLEGLKRGQEADFHFRVAALTPNLVMLDEIMVWVRMHDGPRITHRPTQISQVVWSLSELAAHVDRIEGWTPGRRKWLARELLQAARVCYANDDRGMAADAIRQAFQIDSQVGRNDPFLRRVLSAVLGPARAEKTVNMLRSMKGSNTVR